MRPARYTASILYDVVGLLTASRVVPALLCLLVIIVMGVARPAGAGDLVAIDAEIMQEGEETRLVFTLNGPVEARALHTGSPERAVIDLPRINFQLEMPTGAATGVDRPPCATAFSRAKRSRIVMDPGRACAGDSGRGGLLA